MTCHLFDLEKMWLYFLVMRWLQCSLTKIMKLWLKLPFFFLVCLPLPSPVSLLPPHPVPCPPCRYLQRSLQVGGGGGWAKTTPTSEGSASSRGIGPRHRAADRNAKCGSALWRRRPRSSATWTCHCRWVGLQWAGGGRAGGAGGEACGRPALHKSPSLWSIDRLSSSGGTLRGVFHQFQVVKGHFTNVSVTAIESLGLLTASLTSLLCCSVVLGQLSNSMTTSALPGVLGFNLFDHLLAPKEMVFLISIQLMLSYYDMHPLWVIEKCCKTLFSEPTERSVHVAKRGGSLEAAAAGPQRLSCDKSTEEDRLLRWTFLNCYSPGFLLSLFFWGHMLVKKLNVKCMWTEPCLQLSQLDHKLSRPTSTLLYSGIFSAVV